jgi:DNA-binding GntR family transcriptional regulator
VSVHPGLLPELPEGGQFEYQRVAEALRAGIEAGVVPAGGLLPDIRALARRYGVSEGTARRAVQVLLDEGVLCHVGGRRVYVGREQAAAR